ncbi:hypothetical protein RvY_08572 [Ramazzottius varieornatus]|uniref:Hexosyltransferase n=1 Tax=Ramazzottius varieornatus TaxID=947166 RepID=A0A1D1V6C8_RAMVA|nr:hypothetical protein RvY_08572 [Ramazzottius varieornatus]
MKLMPQFARLNIIILLVLMTILVVYKASRYTIGDEEPFYSARTGKFSAYDQECSKFNGSVDNPFFLNYTSVLRDVAYYSTSLDSIKRGTYHFAVNSQPKAYLARRAIRKTWKKVLVACTENGEASCSGSLRFYIGQTSNEGTALRLKKEMQKYDDIVLLQFCDKYENLALKTFHIMNYVSQQIEHPSNESAPKFVVKIDDDVLPDLSAFFTCFPTLQNASFGIYGWVTLGSASVRKWDKYRISRKRWNHTLFPAFAHGPAYAAQVGTLPVLLGEARRTAVLNLEDVWFTGIVAEKAGVKRMRINRFLNVGESFLQVKTAANSSLRAGFFHHSFSSRMLLVLWQNMRNCSMCIQNCDLFREPAIQYSQSHPLSKYLKPKQAPHE